MRKVEKFAKKYGHKPLALITGGSSGMGLEYARQLAQAGCSLILVSNVQEQLDEAKAELEGNFPDVEVHVKFQDLSLESATADLLAFCDENNFQVDVLINNAGMFFWKELSYPADMGKVNVMMRLHINTVVSTTMAFSGRMKQRGYGYILNVSSMAASLPVPGITTYAATKAFNKSFSKSMFYELRPYGVTVCCVCPAAIATPLYKLDPKLMKFGVSIGAIMTPKRLVKRALRGLFNRRRCIKPGFMNVYLPPLVNGLPKPVVDWAWKKFRK